MQCKAPYHAHQRKSICKRPAAIRGGGGGGLDTPPDTRFDACQPLVKDNVVLRNALKYGHDVEVVVASWTRLSDSRKTRTLYNGSKACGTRLALELARFYALPLGYKVGAIPHG